MTSEELYNQHLKLLQEKAADKIVELDYHDDATMLILTGDEPKAIHGKQAIKELFHGYLEYVYHGFISTEKVVLYDDSIFLEATIDTSKGHLQVYDAMYLKDGKIYRHFTGLK